MSLENPTRGNLETFVHETFLKGVTDEIIQIADKHELSVKEFETVLQESLRSMKDLAIIPSKRRKSRKDRYSDIKE